MKIGFTLWVVILLAVLCSQPTAAYAQTRQYHDTIYTLPDQWVSGAVRADYIDLFQKGHHKQIELMATIDIPESETKLLEWMYDANEMMRGDMGRPKKIEFTADGQYRATQFYGFEKDASGKLNDVAGRLKPTNGEAASSGSYVIKDGTIEFTNGSGRVTELNICLLYTSPSPRDQRGSRMPSSA